jgi:hypothetical protein
VYANDLILVTPTAGVSQLGQRNITYQISNLSDYVTGVILVGQWPALIACDASTPVGQSAGVVKQYPVLGASPLIRCCAEQTFFEQFADAGVTTLADALITGVRNYSIATLGGYNVAGLDSIAEDVSKRQALAWWVNGRNVAMIDCAQVRFNNVVADSLTKESIFVLDEMYSTNGARLSSVAGFYDDIDELILASQQAQCFYTPLYFFFSRKKNNTTAGHSLATASSLYTTTTINVSTLSADLLINVSKPGVVVTNFNSGQPVRDSDVQISLIAEIIQVEIPLRDALALAAYTVAVRYTTTLVYTNNLSQITLDLKNAVKNLAVFARLECATQQFAYFDFLGPAGVPPIAAVTLRFNSVDRINGVSLGLSVASQQLAGFYNVKRVDQNAIWFFSFTSENLNPVSTGSNSFDTYQTIQLKVSFIDSVERFGYQLFVVSEAYNLLRYVDSTGGLVYAVPN